MDAGANLVDDVQANGFWADFNAVHEALDQPGDLVHGDEMLVACGHAGLDITDVVEQVAAAQSGPHHPDGAFGRGLLVEDL